MNITPKRALLSVSNKTGIVEFAKNLVDLGIEVISTGGTSRLLANAGIVHQEIEDITGLPEILGGRVKTLHPKIHGGILGRRDEHGEEAKTLDIAWIDLVVVNFYPFADVIAKPWEEAIEYIDVGGPTMVRAAAKNFAWVGVVVNPDDYSVVVALLQTQKGLDQAMRQQLAEKAFALTAQYDAMIHHYFLEHHPKADQSCPDHLYLQLEKAMPLRYGENPHQKACAYQFKQEKSGVLSAYQHQGKPLSYNNILDSEAAWACAQEFTLPACVIVKHANPCGVACAAHIEHAYELAYHADPVSAFGGIIAINQPCTEKMALAIASIFMEVVIAPAYTKEALAIFASKPNLRILESKKEGLQTWEMKLITGGLLLQEKDTQVIHPHDLKVVTHTLPEQTDIDTMLFAWRVIKHIKSNAILLAKNNTTIGIGAGQVSRIDAVDIALRKAGENKQAAVLASDAFFPFRDSIDRLADTGIRAIIQPGGSMRDEEVIDACDQHGIAMVFTGKRCFRH